MVQYPVSQQDLSVWIRSKEGSSYMKRHILLIGLLIISLLLSGCGKKAEEGPRAKSGFSATVSSDGFPDSRPASDGFDHASFDAAIIASVLGPAAPDENGYTAADTENHVISPADLYLSVAGLAYISGGITRSQLLKFLGVSKIDELEKNVSLLWHTQFYRTSNAASLLGNSLWLSNSFAVPEDRLKDLAEKFYMESYVGRPGSENFDSSYREWLSSMSGGLLNDQIAEASLDEDMALATVTSLFYKALFAQSFQEAATEWDDFYTPTTEKAVYLMHMDETFPYHQDVNFQAAGVPLMNGATLWLLLPAENVTPAQLAADPLMLAWLNEPAYDQSPMSLYLPRFDITEKHSLKDDLIALGVTNAFDPAKADFSGLSSELEQCAVTRVDQAVRMRVFEGGVEATAYTEGFVVSSARPSDMLQFRLDRPFMFALRDYDGTLLFVGIINDPSK